MDIEASRNINVPPKIIYIFLALLAIISSIFQILKFIYEYDDHLVLADKEIYVRLLIICAILILGLLGLILEFRNKKLGYVGPFLIFGLYIVVILANLSEVWIFPSSPESDLFAALMWLILAGGITSIDALRNAAKENTLSKFNTYSGLGVILGLILASNIDFGGHLGTIGYIPFNFMALILGGFYIYLLAKNYRFLRFNLLEQALFFLIVAISILLSFP